MVRDAAEECLEELRRTLEKADGLDEIFYRHMTEPHGKYIVFCANKEHMDEMMEHREWFARVDRHPHRYAFYSGDPEAEKEFTAFKEDNDEEHLRLLYCIDALNEGIHVEDIHGVILLRPTVSPIIFKQQIGRALSASRKTNAVIFDIVLNIENLYSIGAIEDEMEVATSYYRYLGEGDQIVNERFRIIDEVKDCRELFERLNQTLTASWDMYYACAQRYYREFGNLEVPARYMTEEGYSLGSWLFNQKAIRNGKMPGRLTDEQINKLDAIGMVWEQYTDLNWAKNYMAARHYYELHGNLEVPARYVTEEGIALGSWLNTVRTWHRSGVHRNYLSEERIRELEEIGMIWNVLDYYWERNYMAAVEYYHKFGDLEVPAKYKAKDGTLLGSWISRQRNLRRGIGRGTPPTEEQIGKLDAIGMNWNTRVDSKWEHGFSAAEVYARANNSLMVPTAYKTADGFPLGTWIKRQRASYRKGSIDKERVRRLNSIGMVWATDPWESRYKLLQSYYQEHGTIAIPQTRVIEGVWLGKWIVTQKKAMKDGKLTRQQMELLEKLPL